MTSPSLHLVESAVVILGLCSVGLAIVLYLFMHIHHHLQLARGARRVILAARLASVLSGEDLKAKWLQSSQQDREILGDVLADRCRSAHGVGEEAVRQALVEAGIVDYWVGVLRAGSESRRVRAALRLGYVQDAVAIEALLEAVEDSSAEVRRATALSLGRLQDPRGIPGLLRLAQRPRSEIPDLSLAAALAACTKGCPERLTPLLKTQGVRQRQVAAWALSEVAESSVLPELLAAAHDVEPEVRAKVARALSQVPGPDSREALIALAGDSMWFVRVRALAALGRQRAPEGEEAVLRGLEDKVREVRYRAAYALRQIRGMRGETMTGVLKASPRMSFNSLISEWDRAGFLWFLAGELRPSSPSGFRESCEALKALAAHGLTRVLVDFILVYPDVKTRLRLLHIMLTGAGPDLRMKLMPLADQPECDRRVAAAIRKAFSEPASA